MVRRMLEKPQCGSVPQVGVRRGRSDSRCKAVAGSFVRDRVVPTAIRRRKRRRVQPVSMTCRPGVCPGRFWARERRMGARSALAGRGCTPALRRRSGRVWSTRQFLSRFLLGYRYELGMVNSGNEFDHALAGQWRFFMYRRIVLRLQGRGPPLRRRFRAAMGMTGGVVCLKGRDVQVRFPRQRVYLSSA